MIVALALVIAAVWVYVLMLEARVRRLERPRAKQTDAELTPSGD